MPNRTRPWRSVKSMEVPRRRPNRPRSPARRPRVRRRPGPRIARRTTRSGEEEECVGVGYHVVEQVTQLAHRQNQSDRREKLCGPSDARQPSHVLGASRAKRCHTRSRNWSNAPLAGWQWQYVPSVRYSRSPSRASSIPEPRSTSKANVASESTSGPGVVKLVTRVCRPARRRGWPATRPVRRDPAPGTGRLSDRRRQDAGHLEGAAVRRRQRLGQGPSSPPHSPVHREAVGGPFRERA